MSDPIPASLWKRIMEFLKDERTGAITLHVNRGHVEKLKLEEYVRLTEVDKS